MNFILPDFFHLVTNFYGRHMILSSKTFSSTLCAYQEPLCHMSQLQAEVQKMGQKAREQAASGTSKSR